MAKGIDSNRRVDTSSSHRPSSIERRNNNNARSTLNAGLGPAGSLDDLAKIFDALPGSDPAHGALEDAQEAARDGATGSPEEAKKQKDIEAKQAKRQDAAADLAQSDRARNEKAKAAKDQFGNKQHASNIDRAKQFQNITAPSWQTQENKNQLQPHENTPPPEAHAHPEGSEPHPQNNTKPAKTPLAAQQPKKPQMEAHANGVVVIHSESKPEEAKAANPNAEVPAQPDETQDPQAAKQAGEASKTGEPDKAEEKDAKPGAKPGSKESTRSAQTATAVAVQGAQGKSWEVGTGKSQKEKGGQLSLKDLKAKTCKNLGCSGPKPPEGSAEAAQDVKLLGACIAGGFAVISDEDGDGQAEYDLVSLSPDERLEVGGQLMLSGDEKVAINPGQAGAAVYVYNGEIYRVKDSDDLAKLMQIASQDDPNIAKAISDDFKARSESLRIKAEKCRDMHC